MEIGEWRLENGELGKVSPNPKEGGKQHRIGHYSQTA